MGNKIQFSEKPGRHERHFRRKINNLRFPRPINGFTDEQLLEVQRLDHEELMSFITSLKAIVAKAACLPPSSDSEVILSIKESLDKAYEISAGLADDQSQNQLAIEQLTEIIMRTMSKNAAGDSLAAIELEQERNARVSHYALLQQSIVADLLHPDSLIEADELAATLLSESVTGFRAAIDLFDSAQLNEINHELANIKQLPEDGEKFELLHNILTNSNN